MYRTSSAQFRKTEQDSLAASVDFPSLPEQFVHFGDNRPSDETSFPISISNASQPIRTFIMRIHRRASQTKVPMPVGTLVVLLGLTWWCAGATDEATQAALHDAYNSTDPQALNKAGETLEETAQD
jgi:hypothetical protein